MGTELPKTKVILLSFQNYPRVRTLLFGSKSTSLITPDKTIEEKDENVPNPAKYTESRKARKNIRSRSIPSIDENTDVDDEEKHTPKPKLKEYVSYDHIAFIVYVLRYILSNA